MQDFAETQDGETSYVPRNLLDLAVSAEIGDVIKVVTDTSTWWFTITKVRAVKKETIGGVMMHTNSKSMKRMMPVGPDEFQMERLIRLGERIGLGDPNPHYPKMSPVKYGLSTGAVLSVDINDIRVLG